MQIQANQDGENANTNNIIKKINRQDNIISDISSAKVFKQEQYYNKEIHLEDINTQQIEKDLLSQNRQTITNQNDEEIDQILQHKEIKKKLLMIKIKIRFKKIIDDLQQRNITKLGLKQFKLINDWASSFKHFNKGTLIKVNKIFKFVSQLKRIKKQVQSISQKYPPLDPGHAICYIFDIVSFIVTLLIIYGYSIQIGFQFNLEESSFFINLNYFGLTIFILQIFLNLNVGFYYKDDLIKDRKKIFENYKTGLIGDITSILGLIYNIFDNSNTIYTYLIEALFLIKLLSIKQQEKNLQNMLVYKFGQPAWYTLVKMLFYVYWYCHWIALLWHLVNVIEVENLGEINSWIQQNNIQEEQWYIRYIYSYYWAISTIVTGGSMPSTFLEMVVLILLIIPTAILFAFIISEVGQIISERNALSKQFYEQIHAMKKYTNSKKVGMSLQKRIISYLENKYSNQNENYNEKALQIIQKFPKNLKEDLRTEISFRLLNSVKIFNENFSSKTIQDSIKIIEEQHFVPGDIIVSMNSFEDNSLFMIIQGEVEIGMSAGKHSRDIIFGNLPSGLCFGIQSFFSGLAQTFQAKSINYSTIYKIKRKDFYQMIKNNQNTADFEKFCQIRDQLITTNMCPNVYDQCKLCGKKNDHNDIICNLVHYHPYGYKRINAIRRCLYGYQQREKINRQQRNRYHVLSELKQFQLSIDTLLNNDEVINQLEMLYYNNDNDIESNMSGQSDISEINQTFQNNKLNKMSKQTDPNSPNPQQQSSKEIQLTAEILQKQQYEDLSFKKQAKINEPESINYIRFDDTFFLDNQQKHQQQQSSHNQLKDQQISQDENKLKIIEKKYIIGKKNDSNEVLLQKPNKSQFKGGGYSVSSLNIIDQQQQQNQKTIKNVEIDEQKLQDKNKTSLMCYTTQNDSDNIIDREFDIIKSFQNFNPNYNFNSIISQLIQQQKQLVQFTQPHSGLKTNNVIRFNKIRNKTQIICSLNEQSNMQKKRFILKKLNNIQ